MTYRILAPNEDHKVAHVFKARGGKMPVYGAIAAALDGDRVIGFLALQPLWHSEPVWVDEAYRGKVNIRHLQHLIESMLPKGSIYYTFTESDQIEHLVELLGAEPLKWRIWKKEV